MRQVTRWHGLATRIELLLDNSRLDFVNSDVKQGEIERGLKSIERG